MKKTQLLSLLLFMLLTMPTAMAQSSKSYTIKGSVIDSLTLEQISYATITLRDSTASVMAVVSEPNGNFTMKFPKKGTYTLVSSYLGYAPNKRTIELADEMTIDLGKIPLSTSNALGEVVVTAQLITSDIDKISYNTAQDPETPALTALEMMRKVPMLSVDSEDELKLKGQSNYKILVNGKNNTMMSKDYKAVLRSMPATSIKSIEVITNPPVKYEAEGIAGIINIITVRKTNDAYNASIDLNGDEFGGRGAGVYAAMSMGKLSFSGRFGYNEWKRPGSSSWSQTTDKSQIETLGEQYINSNSSSTNKSRNKHFGADGSYEIDSLNLISLSLWGYMGNYNNDNWNVTEFSNSNHIIQKAYRNSGLSSGTYGSISGNIDWQKTFIKPDKTLTVSYLIDNSPRDSYYDNIIKGLEEYPEIYPDRFQRSKNDGSGGEHTIQVDYFDPLTKKHNIEFGAKYIMRPNTSNTFNEKQIDGIRLEDLTRKNDLDYTQHIAGAYGGYQLKLKKFSIKGGFRAEYTVNTGTFKLADNHDLFNRNFNIVPYITTSYKLSDSKSFRLGYTQRLRRPGIWYLNPYVNDEDPQNISSGNPNLKSEVSHSIDLSFNSFSSKGNLGASLTANFSNNSIESIVTMRDGITYNTFENWGKKTYFGGYVYTGRNFWDGKLRFNLSLNGAYSMLESSGSDSKNFGFNYGFHGNIDAKVWKNANLNINYGFWSSDIGLQSIGSHYTYSGISVSQSLLKNKQLRLSIGVRNPLSKDNVYSNESFGNGFHTYSENTVVNRSIKFGLQWKFGKSISEVKKARRGISNDDKMGGGSSSGGGQ